MPGPAPFEAKGKATGARVPVCTLPWINIRANRTSAGKGRVGLNGTQSRCQLNRFSLFLTSDVTLAVLQQCWIAVNGFPFLPFVICPRWVEASLLAWASPSTKVETRGATCMCFQKRSGLTQPNCLTKAYFSSFHTGPLPDPNVSLIFKEKMHQQTEQTKVKLCFKTQRKYLEQSFCSRC